MTRVSNLKTGKNMLEEVELTSKIIDNSLTLFLNKKQIAEVDVESYDKQVIRNYMADAMDWDEEEKQEDFPLVNVTIRAKDPKVNIMLEHLSDVEFSFIVSGENVYAEVYLENDEVDKLLFL